MRTNPRSHGGQLLREFLSCSHEEREEKIILSGRLTKMGGAVCFIFV